MLARVLGRSDDGRWLVLRQEGPAGTVFRWPTPPSFRDADGECARVTVRPGVAGGASTFNVFRAGSYLFFRSPALEFALHFNLLPALPPVAEVTIELLPAEVSEGVEEVAGTGVSREPG